MLELHARFCGRVQGVGFRWTVVDHAERCHLTGTVQNLVDGSVEVIAQGSQDNLEAFLDAVCKESGHASLDSVHTSFHQSMQTFTTFRIIH